MTTKHSMWDLESCAPLIWNRVHRSPTDFEYSGCTLFAGFSVVYPLNTLCVNGTRCPGRAAVARAATAAPAPALAPLCLIALVGTCVAVACMQLEASALRAPLHSAHYWHCSLFLRMASLPVVICMWTCTGKHTTDAAAPRPQPCRHATIELAEAECPR